MKKSAFFLITFCLLVLTCVSCNKNIKPSDTSINAIDKDIAIKFDLVNPFVCDYASYTQISDNSTQWSFDIYVIHNGSVNVSTSGGCLDHNIQFSNGTTETSTSFSLPTNSDNNICVLVSDECNNLYSECISFDIEYEVYDANATSIIGLEFTAPFYESLIVNNSVGNSSVPFNDEWYLRSLGISQDCATYILENIDRSHHYKYLIEMQRGVSIKRTSAESIMDLFNP